MRETSSVSCDHPCGLGWASIQLESSQHLSLVAIPPHMGTPQSFCMHTVELSCGPRTVLNDHPQDLGDPIRGRLTGGFCCATEYVMDVQ